MKKQLLKEGDPVCHVSNLGVVFSISKIIYESREILCEKGHPKSYVGPDGNHYFRRSFLQGIEIMRIEQIGDNIENFKTVVHSNSIIPYEIVKQGKDAVTMYMDAMMKIGPVKKEQS